VDVIKITWESNLLYNFFQDMMLMITYFRTSLYTTSLSLISIYQALITSMMIDIEEIMMLIEEALTNKSSGADRITSSIKAEY
jgi:hypothetical protein